MIKKIPPWMLHEWQSQSLDWKIERSLQRIKEFYEANEGETYVAYSGGKDSTVLLHLVRSLYPEVEAVFIDTGLEYPEIKGFVKQTSSVTTLRPKMSFREVLDKYGYPVVSKEVSMAISRYRNTKDSAMKNFRLYGVRKGKGGYHMGVIPRKWSYLVNAPFKISDACCDVMKKKPFNRYMKETGRVPYMGVMAGDSVRREREFLKYGCNTFGSNPSSKPLSFWLEEDVWGYIKRFNIPYSKIYDMGEKRTGCVFCMFGCHLEPHPNRFRRMKTTHPQLWNYCMNQLNLREILAYLGVDSGINTLNNLLNPQ